LRNVTTLLPPSIFWLDLYILEHEGEGQHCSSTQKNIFCRSQKKYNFLVFGFASNKLTQNLYCLPFIYTSYDAALKSIIVYCKKFTIPETHHSTTNKG
jgi:hypothetical protein